MVYNYHGSKGFRSAKLSSFAFGETAFVQQQIGQLSTHADDGSHCRSLLSYSQDFSLSLMQSIDYVSNEQVAFQKNVETEVLPEQVTFVEISSVEKGQKLLGADGVPVPYKQKGEVLTRVLGANRFEYRERKKTAMWSVSGQVLIPHLENPNKMDVEIKNLPWQNDPNFMHPENALDRNKYQLVWELGRSGQVQGQRLILYNMTALLLAAHKERKYLEQAMGPSDAYVFAHALDMLHTKLFKRLYGGEIFTTDKNDPGNNILVMSLDKMLQRYPIHKISERVDALMQVAENQITDIEAIDLIDSFNHALMAQLDVYDGSQMVQDQPVIIENYAMASYQAQLRLKLDQLDVDQQIKNKIYYHMIRKLPLSYTPSFEGSDHKQFFQPWKRLGRENSILISNLGANNVADNENTEVDIESIMQTLVAIKIQTEAQANEAKEKLGLNLFKNGEFTYIVRTKNTDLANKLVALGGKRTQNFDGQRTFDIKLSSDLIKSANQSQYQLIKGYWYYHNLLSKPLEF